MKIESKIGKAGFPSKSIFEFISDFRNFRNIIPEDKVSNWQAAPDHCTFSIDMLGKVGLQIVEREAYKLVKISSDSAISQYNFNLWLQLKEVSDNDTRVKVTIEPLLNQVMLAMVKKPLKSLVDSIVDEIESFNFQTQ